MSCNHCSTKFNFFHKELGCANCGLSFCSKCLRQKCKILSKGTQDFNVCRVCHSKIMLGSTENDVIVPPDRFLKRLENLENPAAPPITMYKQDPKINALKSGLSAADQELVDRLEKLKEKTVLPPSDSEIRERLAKLKGESLTSSSDSKHIFASDTRTDQEKVSTLLEQYMSEQGIEVSHQTHDDLEKRLADLKGEKCKKNNQFTEINESDSEEEVENITKKMVAEVSLDERCKLDIPDDEEMRPSSPELPWCVLCNDDAKFRCLDCEDLYCKSCNIEIHQNWEDRDHKVIPFGPKH